VYARLLALLALLVFLGGTASAQTQTDPVAVPTEPQKEAESSEAVEEPKPELTRPTVWGEPTEVRIGIFVIDVDEVSSAQQRFSASVYFEARWDIPTLQHEGPGPLHRAWTEVWTPRLTIINQQQTWRAFPESVEILPSGEVIYRQKVWGQFSQPLDLRAFPQDSQKLKIHVGAAGLAESEVRMVPLVTQRGDTNGIAPSFSLPDFDVMSWSVRSVPYVPFEGHAALAAFQMEIEIQRRVTYFVIKIIIPLCLIVIMSWVPRWIDPREIGASLGISGTAFLTLIAYLFAITVLLPPVAYITRMDRFILLSTLMVFMSLIHTVLNTALVKKLKKIHNVQRFNRWSALVYMAALLLVLRLSFDIPDASLWMQEITNFWTTGL
jgi:hypothetical protein